MTNRMCHPWPHWPVVNSTRTIDRAGVLTKNQWSTSRCYLHSPHRNGKSLRMNTAAFSLLGKRAFFVTQSPETIIRRFSCLSCPHRDDLTFVSDWGFWLLGKFCSLFLYPFCLVREVVWPQTSRNWKEWWVTAFLQRTSDSMCRFTCPYIQYTYLFDTYKNIHLMYTWASCGCPRGK